jgi:hypothetical protein
MVQKFFLFIFFLFGTICSQRANCGGSKDGGDYVSNQLTLKVKNKVYDETIPEGFFVLWGKVRNARFGKLKGVSFSTSTGPEHIIDKSGNFRLMFAISDTVIMRKSGYGSQQMTGLFKNQHAVEIILHLKRHKQTVWAKPVIYAYNAPGQCKIAIQPKGSFTFTYPVAQGTWDITTNIGGTLTEAKTGKHYPYLFWEGLGKKVDFKVQKKSMEGYLIQTDTCINFLENILSSYGLNEKEAADFITFWAPKMIKEKYALVQFLSTEDYEKRIAEISVSPRPDSVLRLYMYFMPLHEPITGLEVIPPPIKSFTRTGFTIVEWGGSVIHQSSNIYSQVNL